MRYALVGCGRMGQAIDVEARRRGHSKVGSRDAQAAAAGAPLDGRALGGPEVAFEFTTGGVAEQHVVALLDCGIAVVCGTTGWRPSPEVAQAARRGGAGAVIAPNFSLGVNLFARLVREAGRWFGRAGEHHPYVFEAHHAAKLDAPSGTARRLAAILLEADSRLKRAIEGLPQGAVPRDTLHVTSLRAGSEPGMHCVGFDGPHDNVTLTHRARGRSAFAVGAVLAAEWLRDKTGVHDFDEVVDELLEQEHAG